jgi:PTH1 family peptidyl-tRNA hydrolase
VCADQPVQYLLPETFMNKSGDTVAYIVKKQQATPEDFIVLHDDIDLAFGTIKISKGRGGGGNNGVTSIIQTLGSKDFVRIRIGIAPTSFWTGKTKRPQGGGPLERFVLKPFTPSERKQLSDIFSTIDLAVTMVLEQGVEAAMNTYN